MGEPGYMVAARSLIGLKEIVGSKDEPKVVQFFAEAGHSWVKDDETPWCAAFANAMLARGGLKGTGSLAARSFLGWGVKADKPAVGDIAVFPRGNNTTQGHVGFVAKVNTVAGTVDILGGNQANSVNIQTRRISEALSFRRPAESGKLPLDIKEVQRKLRRLGYSPGDIDGDAGPLTMAAVNRFEAARNMPQSKVLTEAVAKAILSATEPPMKPIPVPETDSEARWLRIGAGILGVSFLAAVGAGVAKFLGVW